MIDYSKKSITDGDVNHLGVWHKGVLALHSFTHKKVLDIGCGTGSFLKHLEGVAEERVGVDPNVHNIDVARHTGATVLAMYPEEMHGYDAHFDVVTCFEVIEHLYTHQDIIATCEKVLAPGGSAFITTPNAFHVLRMITFVWSQEHRDSLMDPTRCDEPEHIRLWSYGMATRIVNKHNNLQVSHVCGVTLLFGKVIVLKNKILVTLFAQHLLICLKKKSVPHGSHS